MATFYFSREPPPEHMFTDMQTLSKFEDEQFKELTSIIFVFLLEPNKADRLLTSLAEFAEQHGVSAAALRNTSKTLIAVPNGALRQNLSATQFKEDLIKLGLSEEKAVIFADQYRINLLGLSQSVAGQTLMVNQLIDMEWKFGVTAACNEANKVANTFLQLKLVINKGNKIENVYMELTLPQFYSFLHEMEKAKSSLELLG